MIFAVAAEPASSKVSPHAMDITKRIRLNRFGFLLMPKVLSTLGRRSEVWIFLVAMVGCILLLG